MKKMLMILALMLVAASCSKEYDDSAIWDKLNSFENRLQGLESKVDALNAATNSLKQIVESLNNRKYVEKVITTVDGYVLQFSDGSSISIANGKDGQDGQDGKDGVSAPVIGIKMDVDGQYYWTQTVDGVTSWLLDPYTNNKISATSKAPLLKVDAGGYWVVSYDGGVNYTRVLDAYGQPVKATGKAPEPVIVSVKVEGKFVTLFLATGEEVTLPLETLPVVSYDHAVDLGLSVKWAPFNIGATSSDQPGDKFAWGETYPKTEFTKENYSYNDGNVSYLMIPLKEISGTKYDAARQNWGGRWRMPTYEEMMELVHFCKEEKLPYDAGLKFTGKYNNSICFPNTGTHESKPAPWYWTGTIYLKYIAYTLRFHVESIWYANRAECYKGCAIRPVLDY